MRGLILVFSLLATAAHAQQPSPPEMQAIMQAIAKQRDAAQNLHAQCEMGSAKLNEQIAQLTAEVKALKEKKDAK